MTQALPFLLSEYIQHLCCSQEFTEAPQQRDMEFCEEQAVCCDANPTTQALVSKHTHTCLVLEADLLNWSLWSVKAYTNTRLEIPEELINFHNKTHAEYQLEVAHNWSCFLLKKVTEYDTTKKLGMTSSDSSLVTFQGSSCRESDPWQLLQYLEKALPAL